MELNGLQIGNYIQDSETKRIGSITRFRTNLITCKMKFSTLEQHKDYYNPIKLHPSIIGLLGFKNNESFKNDENSENEYRINIQNGHGVIHDFELIVNFNSSNYTVFIFSEEKEILELRIEYVHQLQNIVNLITGGDLIFIDIREYLSN